MTYTDPSGLFWQWIPVVVSAVLLQGSKVEAPEQEASLRDLPQDVIMDQFAGKYGNPYDRGDAVVSAPGRTTIYPQTTITEDNPVAIRALQAMPVGVDDCLGPALGQSLADAIGGGWGETRLTAYADPNRESIVGWTIEVYSPIPGVEGSALGSPDFDWQLVTDVEFAERLLQTNPDIAADAMDELLRGSIKRDLLRDNLDTQPLPEPEVEIKRNANGEVIGL